MKEIKFKGKEEQKKKECEHNWFDNNLDNTCKCEKCGNPIASNGQNCPVMGFCYPVRGLAEFKVSDDVACTLGAALDEAPAPMPLLLPVNGKIMCEPPESNQIKVSIKAGFAQVVQKTSLVGLKVIAGNTCTCKPGPGIPYVSEGDFVYVRGEAITNHQWAREAFNIEGYPPFILVPVDAVMAVKR